VLVILFLALYPQLALHRSESSVKDAVFPAQAFAANPHAQLHFFTGTAAAVATPTGEPPQAVATESGEGEGDASGAAEAATGESSEGSER
jgi:hypothetical protein